MPSATIPVRARLLLTRPEADAARLRQDLQRMGFSVDSAPMLTIQPLPLAADLALQDVAGLLITSANGLRALAAATARRDLPVYAVGEASARAARQAGFAQVLAAGGDVFSLADLVRRAVPRQAGPLFHAAGETLAGDLKAMLEADGFTVRRETLYRAVPVASFPLQVAENLSKSSYNGVLFFSPRTASGFATLAAPGFAAALSQAAAFCLSAAVAERLAGLPWRRLCIAAEPSEAALLAALDEEFA